MSSTRNATRAPLRLLAGALLLTAGGLAGPAFAEDAPTGGALALHMGCYNCHRTPARHDAPSFEQLAARYEKLRGKTDAADKEGEHLRRGEPFRRIVAHEQLSPDTATKLMQWIIDGAKPSASGG
jgi:cytochrome c551/c552